MTIGQLGLLFSSEGGKRLSRHPRLETGLGMRQATGRQGKMYTKRKHSWPVNRTVFKTEFATFHNTLF
jgi:hypothetical protein